MILRDKMSRGNSNKVFCFIFIIIFIKYNIMKLTKESHKLMSFFTKHNCLIPLDKQKNDAIFKNYIMK